MSKVPLSVNLSGLGLNFGFRWKGSRVLEGFLFFLASFQTSFIPCIKLFTSLCRFFMCRCFGFGMKVRPLRNTFFCVSDRVVFVAKMTNASSAVCG